MVAMVWLGERSIGILLKKEYSKSPKCHFLRCLVRGSNQSNVIRFFNATCCCCGFFFSLQGICLATSGELEGSVFHLKILPFTRQTSTLNKMAVFFFLEW